MQRDYWALIADCRVSPHEIMRDLMRRFPEFAPTDLVRFRATSDHAELEVGDELDVAIPGAAACRVRVVHKDACSLTLATLIGHPEAGRITFAAYRNAAGDVVFHIRSKARSSSPLHYGGFVAVGEPMQTSTWTDFIDAVAFTHGCGVTGSIHAETRHIDEDTDGDVSCTPTFIAQEE